MPGVGQFPSFTSRHNGLSERQERPKEQTLNQRWLWRQRSYLCNPSCFLFSNEGSNIHDLFEGTVEFRYWVLGELLSTALRS